MCRSTHRCRAGGCCRTAAAPRQAASCLGLQLRAALVAFLQAEGEELADDRLIRAPLQHPAGKEEDERHGEHVVDDGDDVHLPRRQAHGPRRRGSRRAARSARPSKSKNTVRYFVSIINLVVVLLSINDNFLIIQDNDQFGKYYFKGSPQAPPQGEPSSLPYALTLIYIHILKFILFVKSGQAYEYVVNFYKIAQG